MRPATSLGRVAALVLGLSTVTVAAWPGFLPDRAALVARQDEEEETSASKTADADTSTITPAPDLSSSADPNSVNLNTATFDPDHTAAKGNSTKKETFDLRSPAGGVSMLEPITTTMVLYKIGEYVTLKWNYTSLLGEPTAVDVLAVDAEATQTHTLTQNMTYESPASYTWDTESYQQENGVSKALRVAKYTLIIHDSDGAPTSAPEAGYLAPYNQLSFGLYTRQNYEPIGSWVCAVCGSAPAKMAAGAAGLAVTLAFGAGAALAVL